MRGIEAATAGQDRPGDARQLVGERHHHGISRGAEADLFPTTVPGLR